jgi:diguanylate cyclase (GGDEF)-like protein
VCLAVEIWDHFYRVNPVALIAASLGLAAVIARMALTFNEHLAMLRTSRIESLTDQLTGLGNRRALMQRLEALFDGGNPPGRLLLLFDLDGFKAYNDAFGHTAGDSLLNRLGERLSRSIAGRGTAYRLGGDEFCVLVDGGYVDLEWVRAAAVASLRETGEAFAITCSSGHVIIPQEATSAEIALQLADRRMYAEKGARIGDFRSRGALLQALAERDNELGRHTAGVAEYASRLAAEAGLRGADAKALRVAAELHDIGKLALPEALLAKPGPLDDQEWELVREHTLIGERIIAADDGLGPVASIVRSSHERWDGGGYPDGLAGEDIPLAARIIAICDAYEAMTSTRAYRDALTHEEAVKELRDSAGTQFDPALVEMFIATIPAIAAVPFARPA